MKILAGCIVRATEFFFHSGYLSAYAHTSPRYNLAPAASSYHLSPAPPAPPPEMPPTAAAEVALGNGVDTASEGMGAIVASSDALVTPATTEGFFLDMFSGADRWTTLLVGVILVFATATFIALIRGRRVTINETEPKEGLDILAQSTT